jgi:hypothetical protein
MKKIALFTFIQIATFSNIYSQSKTIDSNGLQNIEYVKGLFNNELFSEYRYALSALLYYNVLFDWDRYSQKYPELSMQNAKDSLLNFLNKDNSKVGLFLKGVSCYNGEYVKENKELGLKYMIEAYNNNDGNALYLMKEVLKDSELLKYYNFKYPWDFTLPCCRSKNMHTIQYIGGVDNRYDCAKFARPNKIYLTPFNVSALKFDNQTYPGKIIINTPFFSNVDLKRTYNSNSDKLEDHNLFCSDDCIKKVNQYKADGIKLGNKKLDDYANQVIKCAACPKQLKRKDMITIERCACITNDGNDIGTEWGNGVKVCSNQCEESYCISSCKKYGYRKK